LAPPSTTASADLLTDLKCGYLLGANPRKQFLAQLMGVFAGAAIPILEMRSLRKVRPFIPSTMGLGLSMVIPAWNSISIFIGAMLALMFAKYRPALASIYTIPAASGIIAGESLMGVAIALLVALKIIG
jgi:uncharacterized oligopeptide transporter (OPT) family protein